jgi:hypothetical protein
MKRRSPHSRLQNSEAPIAQVDHILQRRWCRQRQDVSTKPGGSVMKLKFVVCVLCALVSALITVTAAQAGTLSWDGDTTGAPTYNRLFTVDTPSAIGTDVAYNSYAFSVSRAGLYAFHGIGDYDNFLTLYVNSFVPSTPTLNALALNDDLDELGASGFSFLLLANTPYFLVTAGYENSDFGAYSNAITGLGVITAVPEPEQYALLALGLLAIGGLKYQRESQAGG